MDNNSVLGIVHSFESLAAVDGEGLRCAVFMQGCPLRCAYCHNVDTQVFVEKTKYTIEELTEKIKRFKPYFNKKGGVTFSGGEPLCQTKFILECAKTLERENVNVTLDTSGHINITDDVENLLRLSELIICDLKFANEEDYKRYCAGDIHLVLNFLKSCERLEKRVWIRTVIVPGINDNEKSLDQYIKIVNSFHNVERYELLGFHTMGFEKYENNRIENQLKGIEPLDEKMLQYLQEYVNTRVNLRLRAKEK